MKKQAFHEVVAQKLIEQLKQGTAPWQRPWVPGVGSSFIPMNPLTGKRYKGINAIQLMSENHSDNRWMTYKQAVALDAQVRKGEKGTLIQYWKFTEQKIRTDAQGTPLLNSNGEALKVNVNLERPRVFFASVFNAGQIDGLAPCVQKEQTWSAIERAEQIITASGALIHHGEGNRAFYRPATDSIHLPNKDQFLRADNYYATALHELAHWTGHTTRLARDLIHPFGSVGYAREELRAEITSMILGDELGIGHDPAQHAAYVGSWIKILQDDPMELFRAAADAEKIQNFVLSLELELLQEQKREQEKTPDYSEVLSAGIENGLEYVTTELMKQNREMGLDDFKHKPLQSPEKMLENPRTLTEGIAMLNDADMTYKTAIAVEKIWLDIPFKQKDLAKQMAGTLPNGQKAIAWDKNTSRWWALPGADLEKLALWLPEKVKVGEMPSDEAVISGTMAVEKTWLALPYGEREAVKQLAGKRPDGSGFVEWDKAKKCWFAHPGSNLDTLAPWIAEKNLWLQEAALSPVQEFSDILQRVGCLVTGAHPIMDGQKHRIETDGDKKGEKAGFYVGHLDGHPAGYIKNNRTGVEIKWKSKGYSLLPEEKARLQAEAAEKCQARHEAKMASQEKVALRIKKQMMDLIPLTRPTPYLQTKGVTPFTGIFTDKTGMTTCIPATDEQGKIWTMQYIQEDGTKRFAKDSRKEGCFHVLGGMDALVAAPALVIAEGYATAASVSEALGYATVAAFDAGNFKQVACVLHARFPEKAVIIIGDNDLYLEKTQGINPGATMSREAALAVGGIALLPIFAPDEQTGNSKDFTDFNDLATKRKLGPEGVKRQLKGIIDNAVTQNLKKSCQLLNDKTVALMRSA